MEQHTDCSYCMCGTDNTLVDAFGIPMLDLPASKLILFKEQSHKGRVIVASKQHVDDISCMSEEDAAAFMADVRHVAAALHKAFSVPDSELFDPNRAALSERAFASYFGRLPDSDMRRITREDVAHHNEAILP